MKTITAKHYIKLIEWSDEDRCFVGSAPPLIGRCCHGTDEQKVYRDLCRIVDEWIAIHKTDHRPLPAPSAGKQYSGKFLLRVDPALHRQLALHAELEGESLNSYIAAKLAGA